MPGLVPLALIQAPHLAGGIESDRNRTWNVGFYAGAGTPHRLVSARDLAKCQRDSKVMICKMRKR